MPAFLRLATALLIPLMCRAQTSVFTSYLAPLSESGVSANVTIYTEGLDSIYVVLVTKNLATSCDLNSCGAHVHANTGCTPTTWGGHHLNVDGATDAWTGKMQYQRTEITGEHVYTISITNGNTAIAGKPFILHGASGGKEACGMLDAGTVYSGTAGGYRLVRGPRLFTATLVPIPPSTVSGTVAIWTATSTLSVVIQASSALAVACKSNTCGAHVHAGTACTSAEWGGHQLNLDGVTDAWSDQMSYVSTDLGEGSSTYSIDILSGNVAVEGKPFILHGASGGKEACGILAPATSLVRKYVATLYPIAPSLVSGFATIYTTDVSLYLIVTASSQLDEACRENACIAHVHEGINCIPAEWGGHQLNIDGSDSWTTTMQYKGTNEDGSSVYTIDVEFANTIIVGKPMIIHGANGGKEACGLLNYAAYGGEDYAVANFGTRTYAPTAGNNTGGVESNAEDGAASSASGTIIALWVVFGVASFVAVLAAIGVVAFLIFHFTLEKRMATGGAESAAEAENASQIELAPLKEDKDGEPFGLPASATLSRSYVNPAADAAAKPAAEQLSSPPRLYVNPAAAGARAAAPVAHRQPKPLPTVQHL